MDSMNLTLAYTLIAVGFLLLAAELFIPTSGTLFVFALAAIAGGVVMAFMYDTSTGLVTLIVVVIAMPVAGSVLLHYWPKTPMGKRLFLSTPLDDEKAALMPVHLELESLRGRFGKAVGSLRPSGIADFDGWRVDVITEGLMVDSGQWVRCMDVKAGRVIVRPVEKPNLEDLENVDFS
jgi:membrane-bound ClpP family serine protease